MTSPPLRRHDLLRLAAAQLSEPPQAEPVLTWPALPPIAKDTLAAPSNATSTATSTNTAPNTAPAAGAPAGPPAARHASSSASPPAASHATAFIPTSISARHRQRPALPPLLRWASRIDSWPPALWMSLQALALWPVLRWAMQRFASDPAALLALLPLSLLAVATWRGRLSCDWPARPGWLAASAVLSMAVTASIGVLSWPELAGASALAAGCSWAAFRKPGTPVLPVMGLLLLSLPLNVSDPSLILRPDGFLVLPLWLLWLACCTAGAAALWNRLHDLRFLARLPGSALTAVLATVMQVGILMNWPVPDQPLEEGAMDASYALLTLASSAAVCAMVLHLMRREVKDATR